MPTDGDQHSKHRTHSSWASWIPRGGKASVIHFKYPTYISFHHTTDRAERENKQTKKWNTERGKIIVLLWRIFSFPSEIWSPPFLHPEESLRWWIYGRNQQDSLISGLANGRSHRRYRWAGLRSGWPVALFLYRGLKLWSATLLKPNLRSFFGLSHILPLNPSFLAIATSLMIYLIAAVIAQDRDTYVLPIGIPPTKDPLYF